MAQPWQVTIESVCASTKMPLPGSQAAKDLVDRADIQEDDDAEELQGNEAGGSQSTN